MGQARTGAMEGAHGMSKIVVIGAGIGGMSAAARLAKAGHDVSIYEASDRSGGKCRTEWIGKYAFDTGPSLLTLPAVFKDLFLKTGGHLQHQLELTPVNPAFDYRFHDGTQVTFENLSHHQTLQNIEAAFGPTARDEWRKLMKRAAKMWDTSREAFIESELTSIASLFKRPSFIGDLFTIAPWKSLRQLTSEITKDSHLRYIIDRYATYTGSDPRLAPAVLLSIAFVEESFGAWHISGGVGKLSEALEERCRKVGVTFHFDSEVSEILQDGKKATGIQLRSGENIVADIVISNSDAANTYNYLLPTNLRATRKARKSLEKSQSSLAGFSLLLGLRPDESAQRLNHHTVLFPENYEDEFDAIFTRNEPVPNPTIYICAPDDKAMVKTEGHESWFVLVNAPRHSVTGDGFDWSNEKFSQSYAAKIIDAIEARGISVRSRLEVMEIRTPLDLQNAVLAPGGSIYGSSSNGARSAFLRAKNRSPLKNLYCVGGSAHPGGGLPLVGISGEIVANAIVGKSPAAPGAH